MSCPLPPWASREAGGRGKDRAPKQARQGGGHSHYNMIKKRRLRASAHQLCPLRGEVRSPGTEPHIPRPMACLTRSALEKQKAKEALVYPKESMPGPRLRCLSADSASSASQKALLTEPLPHNHLPCGVVPVCWVRPRKGPGQTGQGGHGCAIFILARTPLPAGSRSHL